MNSQSMVGSPSRRPPVDRLILMTAAPSQLSQGCYQRRPCPDPIVSSTALYSQRSQNQSAVDSKSLPDLQYGYATSGSISVESPAWLVRDPVTESRSVETTEESRESSHRRHYSEDHNFGVMRTDASNMRILSIAPSKDEELIPAPPLHQQHLLLTIPNRIHKPIAMAPVRRNFPPKSPENGHNVHIDSKSKTQPLSPRNIFSGSFDAATSTKKRRNRSRSNGRSPSKSGRKTSRSTSPRKYSSPRRDRYSPVSPPKHNRSRTPDPHTFDTDSKGNEKKLMRRSKTPDHRVKISEAEKVNIDNKLRQEAQMMSKTVKSARSTHDLRVSTPVRHRTRSKTPERKVTRTDSTRPQQDNAPRKGFFRKLFQKRKTMSRSDTQLNSNNSEPKNRVEDESDTASSDAETMLHTNAIVESGTSSSIAKANNSIVSCIPISSPDQGITLELISIDSVSTNQKRESTACPSITPENRSIDKNGDTADNRNMEYHYAVKNTTSPSKTLLSVNEDRPEIFYASDEISVLTNPTLDGVSHGYGGHSVSSSLMRIRRDPSDKSEHSADPLGRYWKSFDNNGKPNPNNLDSQIQISRSGSRTKISPIAIASLHSPFFEDPDGKSPIVRSCISNPKNLDPTPRNQSKQCVFTSATQEYTMRLQHVDPSPQGFYRKTTPEFHDPTSDSPMHKQQRGPSQIRDGSPLTQDTPLIVNQPPDGLEGSVSDEVAHMAGYQYTKTTSANTKANLLLLVNRQHGSPVRRRLKGVLSSTAKPGLSSHNISADKDKSIATIQMAPKLPYSSTMSISRSPKSSTDNLAGSRSKKLSHIKNKRIGITSVVAVSKFTKPLPIAKNTESFQTMQPLTQPLISTKSPDQILSMTIDRDDSRLEKDGTSSKSSSSTFFGFRLPRRRRHVSKAQERATADTPMMKSQRLVPLESTSVVSHDMKADQVVPYKDRYQDTQMKLTVAPDIIEKGSGTEFLSRMKKDPSPRKNWVRERKTFENNNNASFPVPSAVQNIIATDVLATTNEFSMLKPDGDRICSIYYLKNKRKFQNRRFKQTSKTVMVVNTFEQNLAEKTSADDDIHPSFTGVSSLTMDIESTMIVNRLTAPAQNMIEVAMNRDVSLSSQAVEKGFELFREKREHDILTGRSSRVIPPLHNKVKNVSDDIMNDDDESLDPIQRAGRRLLSKAAIPIQAQIRRYLAQNQAVDRMWALLEIQSFMRRWRAEAHFIACFLSAVTVQTIFRGYKARTCYRSYRKSALRIQTATRRYLVEAKTFDFIETIILLQSHIRGWVARFRINKHLTAIMEKDMQHSALRLQTWWRSRFPSMLYKYLLVDTIIAQSVVRRHQAKTKVKKLVEVRDAKAATVIQTAWRGYMFYTDYVFCKLDVVIIQRSFRGWKSRKDTRARKRDSSAMAIQTWWRCYTKNRAYIRLRAAIVIQSKWRYCTAYQHYRRYCSAKVIQKQWRSFHAYSNYIFDLVDIIQVQSLTRAWLGRKYVVVLRKNHAATLIQTAGRRYSAYSFYRRVIAAKKLQCAWRRYKARSAYINHIFSTKIQTLWRSYTARAAFTDYIAARLIQTKWRSYSAKSAYIDYVSATNIQTAWRRYAVRSAFIYYVSARKVQTTWRKFIIYSAFVHYRAATKIQTSWRMHSASMAYLQYRSATKIQAVWRGTQCYTEFIFALADIIRSQRAVRSWLHKKEVETYKKKVSAQRIQSIWRGYSAYAKYRKNQAATILQKYVRRFAALNNYFSAGYKIIMIQTVARAYISRKIYKENLLSFRKAKSANVIQKEVRRSQAEWRFQVSLACIIIMQSVIRMFLASKVVNRIRVYKKNEQAAILIQSFLRRMISQNYANKNRLVKKAAVLIQSTVRRHIVRSETNRYRSLIKSNAATKIQSTWRRFWEFSHYLILQYEVIRMQSLARGKLLRKRYNLQLGCSIMIQAAIRQFLVIKRFQSLQISRAMIMLRANGMKEVSSCKRIQFWWRIILECQKEKKAALIIERFFANIKAKIDKNVEQMSTQPNEKLQYNEEALLEFVWTDSKEKRLQKQQEQLDDKLLEQVWTDTVDSDLFAFSSDSNSDLFDFSTPKSHTSGKPQSPASCNLLSPGGEYYEKKCKSPNSRTPTTKSPRKAKTMSSPSKSQTKNNVSSGSTNSTSIPDLKSVKLEHAPTSKCNISEKSYSEKPDTTASVRRAKHAIKNSLLRLEENTDITFRQVADKFLADDLESEISSVHNVQTPSPLSRRHKKGGKEDLHLDIAELLKAASAVRSVHSNRSQGRKHFPRPSSSSPSTDNASDISSVLEAATAVRALKTSRKHGKPLLVPGHSHRMGSPSYSNHPLSATSSNSSKNNPKPKQSQTISDGIVVLNPFPSYRDQEGLATEYHGEYEYSAEEFGEV